MSSLNLNEDLLKITQWAYQGKMLFNPDITKQAQETVFKYQTAFEISWSYLHEKLSFLEHMDKKIKKATIGVNLTHKLNLLLLSLSLLKIYKCFIRPHLDCCL